MSERTTESLPRDLQECSWRFAEWRAKQPENSGPRRIPKDFWDLAVSMAEKYKIGDVSFALKLNSAVLKEKIDSKMRAMEAESFQQMSAT